MGSIDSFTLIQTATLILGFYMAWNIGANDVANAMGTSVGSKALTLKRAVLLAAILEFSGAFFFGSNVSQTIQKGIIDPSIFQADPMIFVFGMMGALFATGAALQIASYLALPVSTTHAIVGAVLGFGLCIGGPHAVNWSAMGWIVSSWVISPFLSGLVSYTIYSIIKKQILSSPYPTERAQKLTPYFVSLSLTLVAAMLSFEKIPSIPLALTLSSFTAITTFAFCQFALLRFAPLQLATGHSFQTDKHHDVEKIFTALQILSACLVAFAHGANDVANAIGPVAAVLGILETGHFAGHASVPSWLLALGGFGIVLGLATWGWRVIETIGKKITELTPTRGFAAEFGAAFTILIASKLGLPISTTHALIGAVFGVGLARSLNSLNFQTIKEILISWIITIPFCAALSVLAFHLLQLAI